MTPHHSNLDDRADTGSLQRAIRLPHATAMVVGTIIGSGIFAQPSEVTGKMPTIGGALSVWAAAGLLSLIGALVCAELSSRFTETGGVYVYLRETYGRSLGFLWGWAMFWVMHSGIIALIAMIFARYADYLLPLSEWGQKLVAIAVIWILSIINYVGVKHGTMLQTLFTLGKLIAVAAIVLIGFTLGSRIEAHFVTPTDPPPTTIANFFHALVAGLFAFGGWHMVTYNAEETVNPKRTIPRALLIGTLVVTGCYVLLNTAYFYILPLEQVSASKRVAADAAEAVLGPNAGIAISGLVMFSTFGALAGIVLAGPRVYLAMSRDGLLFRWFGRVHPTYRTPHIAILAQAIWASALVATGTYADLFTRVIYTEWLFFGLMAIGALMLRRRSGRAQYTVWGGPLLPAIFIAFSFAIVVNQVITELLKSSIGLGIVLLGLPVYLLWSWWTRKAMMPR